MTSKTDNIHVAIRVRPLSQKELSSGQYEAWSVQSNSYIFQTGSDGRPLQNSTGYVFDKIFSTETTNNLYTEIAKDIILSSLDGVNGTIFTYGQTSSGKTYTMQGTQSEPGIIPLSMSDIFQTIQNTPEREYLLRVSYLEIYNEIVKDLLKPGNDNLKIHETLDRNIFVGNLTEEIVLSAEDVVALLSRGDGNRSVGVTNMNERSSRSHTIFRMVIESRERSSSINDQRLSFTKAVKVSCLNLVDLAGSERVGHTGAEGIRLKEGGHINKSLLALGTVIAKLSDGNDSYIPYRDSKLTRILQPSLGGNARTAIICTVTPASLYVEETLSTLKFASRAKTIRNKPEVNEVVSEEALLKKYRNEINTLKRQLEELQYDDAQETERKVAVDDLNRRNLLMYEEQQKVLQEKIDKITRMILNDNSSNRFSSHQGKKQKILRRKTWFPGTMNTSFEEEEPHEKSVEYPVAPILPRISLGGEKSIIISTQKRLIDASTSPVKDLEEKPQQQVIEIEELKAKITEYEKIHLSLTDDQNLAREKIKDAFEKLTSELHFAQEEGRAYEEAYNGSQKRLFDIEEQLNSQKDSLIRENMELKMLVETLRKENRDQSGEIDSLHDQMDDLTAANEFLSLNLQTRESEFGSKERTLTVELEKIRKEHSNLQEQLSSTNELLRKLQAENDNLSREIQQKDQAIDKMKSTIEMVEREESESVEQTKIEANLLVEQNRCLAEEIYRLKQENKAFLEDKQIMEESNQNIVQRLNNEMESMTTLFADLEEKFTQLERSSGAELVELKTRLEGKLHQAELESSSLRIKVEEFQDLNNHLQINIQRIMKEKDDCQAYSEEIKSSLHETRIHLENSQDSLRFSEKQVVELTLECERLNQNIHKEDEHLEEILEEKEALKKELIALETKMAAQEEIQENLVHEKKSLQHQLEETSSSYESKISQLTEEILRLQLELESADKVSSDLRDEIISLQSDLSEKSRLIQNGKEYLTELKSQIDVYRNAANESKLELHELEQANIALSTRVTDLENIEAKLSLELQSVTERNRELIRTEKAFLEEVNELRQYSKQLEITLRDTVTRNEDLTRTCEKQESDIEKGKAYVKELVESYNQTVSEKNQLKRDIESLTELYERLLKEIDEKSIELSQQSIQHDAIIQKMKTDAREELQYIIRKHEKKINEYEVALKALNDLSDANSPGYARGVMMKMETEVESLKGEIRQFKELANDYETKIAELKRELQRTREIKDKQQAEIDKLYKLSNEQGQNGGQTIRHSRTYANYGSENTQPNTLAIPAQIAPLKPRRNIPTRQHTTDQSECKQQ